MSPFTAAPIAAERTLEFLGTQISNDHTRKAYLNAVKTFSAWCLAKAIFELEQIESIHVATYIKELGQRRAAATVKQHLAALRVLFDWLVTSQVLALNPAHAVRGPKHIVKASKTPVLTAEEARTLLNSIHTTRAHRRQQLPCLLGLRDRALIGVMIYAFARVNAVIELKRKDYYMLGRRGWLHLHEKGGKEHDAPCHHNLERFLNEYIAAADIDEESDKPLFRTLGGRTGKLTPRALSQQDAHRVVRRRAALAGLRTQIGNHTFRATGITAYLKNGGRSS